MKKLVLLTTYLSITCLFISNSYAQNVTVDEKEFIKDNSGWNIGLSIGALLYDQLQYRTYSSELTSELGWISSETGQSSIRQTIPAVTIAGQYKSNESDASFDTSIMYVQHKLNEANDDLASLNKIIMLFGGDYNFSKETSDINPYVTVDFGAAFNNIFWSEGNIPIVYGNSDETNNTSENESEEVIKDVEKWAMSIVSQVGAGVNVRLSSVELGVLYNYLLTNGYNLYYSWTKDDVEYLSRFDFSDLGGHKVELKITVPVHIFVHSKK